MIAGAIWAQEAWGRYWGWDPKETWSFITWTIFAGYLHARATSRVEGPSRRRDRHRGVRLAADHVLRREPVDRGAALAMRSRCARARCTSRRERAGGTVRASRRPGGRRGRPVRERGDRARRRSLWALGLVGPGPAARGVRARRHAEHAQARRRPCDRSRRTCSSSVFWIAVAVFVIVEGGILLHRDPLPPSQGSRAHAEADPRQHAAGDRLDDRARGGAGGGDGAHGLDDLGSGAPADATTRSTSPCKGYQWWWGFEYPTPTWSTGSATSSRSDRRRDGGAHRPRDLPARWRPRAAAPRTPTATPDFQVIHSFWVPELFGKQDVVPGRTNHILFQVDEPGHLHGPVRGVLRAAARPDEAPRRRARSRRLGAVGRNQQQLAPAATHDPLAQQGEELFMNPLSDGRGACTACHAVGDVGRRRPGRT